MELKLGQKARDRVTGFEGTVTGKVDYISGCNQALLTPRVGADGKYVDPMWFDVQRLEETDDQNVLKLDNAQTPGSDLAAPKR